MLKLVKKPKNELTFENRDKVIPKLQPGDHVWLGRSEFPCCDGIKTVVRVTRTQIVIKFSETSDIEMRFGRITGYRIGGGHFSNYITAIATPEEMLEAEEEQKHKAEIAAQERERKSRLQEKQKELNLLFHQDARIDVRHEEFSTTSIWTVVFSGLTEEEVIELATKIA